MDEIPALASGQITPKDDYWARQRVVVVDDATAAALETARRTAEAKKSGPVDVLSLLTHLPPIVARFALGPVAMIVTELAIQFVIPALKDLRAKGITVLPMSYSDSKQFAFPVGHPVPGVVYVADPTNRKGYLPAGDFHRVVAQRKCAEAILLLTSLGATSLTVHALDSNSSETKVGLSGSGSVGERDVEVGLGARHHSATTGAVTFEARLQGHDPEALPDGLKWYEDEPLWKAIARARRKNGMGHFTLEVEYATDYGIDAGFFAQIVDVNLKLGGSREAGLVRRWRIEGEFSELSSLVPLNARADE